MSLKLNAIDMIDASNGFYSYRLSINFHKWREDEKEHKYSHSTTITTTNNNEYKCDETKKENCTKK